MIAKVNPYLRPLYDALFDMMDMERATSVIERGDIEIAPLAFMRGRTLNDSFVILDEAQNTTAEQMKMFLTRLGFNSKAVVTGDITQVDLPPERVSGLIEVRDILCHVEGIELSISTNATWSAISWCKTSSRPTTNMRAPDSPQARLRRRALSLVRVPQTVAPVLVYSTENFRGANRINNAGLLPVPHPPP